ncbi:restriction endonuclease subunit S [Mammaliicoccus sciuri]|uniref:restriction endonuclease subunit S n=1 Tax=Mammaliicoccus sciuri TaxID=1296 RepID=UPI001FB34DAA|nr:restriction endonuclease subunit S [Mammaliicoccus sciuri]MCJ1765042.1 restriction endonuclease subunit S [Mammaliicoccus sciuri]MCJ1774062.1 restriction endonuclease subunit S [Mammaliicoccus sciuri]
MEFKKVKLGEISIITMGQSPKSEFYSEIDGTPFLQGNRTFQHIYPVIDTYTKKVTKLANANDILFSVRAPVGDINIAPVDLCIGRGLCAIRSINNNQEFLFYLLKSIINELESQATGTIFSSVNKKTLENFIVNIPNEKQQKNIGTILSNLDNKIELNQKIIANLEELSQTLFKRWFVDFEFPDANGNPYKTSGGEMVDSELGEIPRGWAIGHFNQFCKKPIAGDWGKEHQQGNYNKPVRIIRGADINDYSEGGKGKSPIRFILEKNFDNKKLISGDIIVEISGGSPTQSTGRTLLINKEILQNSNYGLVCTNFCKVIRPVDEKYGEWIAYYFNYLYFRDVFFNYENGTTGIKNLDYKSILNTMKIIVPITQILNNFHNVISNYKINIQRLGKENDYLSQLRDTLLPKLMSGEIEIPDDIEVNEDELSI